jgi:hypothetical protein
MLRAVLIALLGAWIAGTVVVAAVATQNFRTIDRLLTAPSPDFANSIAPLGAERARTVLRYLSSELNRRYFTAWAFTQLALSLLLVFGALGLKPIDRAGTLGATAILSLVIGLILVNWWLIPLGRGLDFVPRTPPPPALARFAQLHLLYTSLDSLKLLLCAWLLVRWIRWANRISPKR